MQDDDALLEYLDDDGQPVEPRYYMPIIPMILVNGAEGIGTGWSTYIPPYDPLDLIDALLALLDNKPLPGLKPWFRGFVGEVIDGNKPGLFVVRGRAQLDDNKLTITELPVGVWTQTYKEFLESLMPNKESKVFNFLVFL